MYVSSAPWPPSCDAPPSCAQLVFTSQAFVCRAVLTLRFFLLQKSPPAALGVAQMFQIIRFCGERYVAACVMLCRTRVGVLLGRATAVILFFVSPYQLTAFHSLPLQKRPRAALGVAQKSTLCFIFNVIHIIMHPRECISKEQPRSDKATLLDGQEILQSCGRLAPKQVIRKKVMAKLP